MRQYLIADSGGSKTDWCFIDFCKTTTYFTTKSYHPSNCNKAFTDSEREFWKSHFHMLSAEVFFFGAGCLNDQGRNQLDDTLRKIGFKDVTVKSDLHGAGLALFGNKSGSVVILGTGSVLFDWDKGDVKNIAGGKGHLIGDEGSGFYFGKLVFEAFKEGRLTPQQRVVFESVADLSKINIAIQTNTQKFILGELSFKLRKHNQLFKEFHVFNTTLFCEKQLGLTTAKNYSIVGGYGYHHREIVRSVFKTFNHNTVRFLSRPIEAVVEHFKSVND
ncbi:MAG: hypothetical protein P8N52_06030 [Crocinitomicaceae bacterium]|nr:hypothetical protein [Crocinitomicaceae bacterium]MDG1775954.1 hypothetical protein [Crocinitomicaceae bacterium]